MTTTNKQTITPQQMINHFRVLSNKFDVALLNAKQDVGRMAVDFFKKSFEVGGFYMSEDKWAKRKHEYNWGILDKTGALKDSIVYELHEGRGLTIKTDESRFAPQRGTRDSNSYAVFHNDPTGTWRLNQYTDEPQVQRQFIGRSQYLEKQILDRLSIIFQHLFNA